MADLSFSYLYSKRLKKRQYHNMNMTNVNKMQHKKLHNFDLVYVWSLMLELALLSQKCEIKNQPGGEGRN